MNFALDPKIKTTNTKERYKNTNFKKITVSKFLSSAAIDDSQILNDISQSNNQSTILPLNYSQVTKKRHYRNNSESNLRQNNKYINKILSEYDQHNQEKAIKQQEIQQQLNTDQSILKRIQKSNTTNTSLSPNQKQQNPQKFIPFSNERDRTGKLISHKRTTSNTLLAQQNNYQDVSPDKIKTRDQTTFHTLDKLRIQKHLAPTWKQLDNHYQNKAQKIKRTKNKIIPFDRNEIMNSEEQAQQDIIDSKLNHLFDINEGIGQTNNTFSVNLSQQINFNTNLIRSPENQENSYQNTSNANSSQFQKPTNFQQFTQLQNKNVNLQNIQQSIFDSPMKKKRDNNDSINIVDSNKRYSVGNMGGTQDTLDNELFSKQQSQYQSQFNSNQKISQNSNNENDSKQKKLFYSQNNISNIEPQYDSKSKNIVNAYQQVLELKNKFKLQTYKLKNTKIIENMKINFVSGKAKFHKQYKDKTRMQTQYTQIQQPLNVDSSVQSSQKYTNPTIKSKKEQNTQPKLNYFHADYSKTEEPQPDKYQQIMEQIKEKQQILPILKVGKNNSILQEAFQQRQHKKKFQRNLVCNEDKISDENISTMFQNAKHSHKQLKNEIESWKTKDYHDLEMEKRLKDVQL